MSRLFKLRKNEKGQALVEFAIVLPVIILLVLGSIEYGWLLYGKITLNSAAREGARVGAVMNTTETIRKQKVLEAIKSTSNLSNIIINDSESKVIEKNDFGENIHNIEVTVKAEMKPIIGLFVNNNVVMTSIATMRRE